MTYFFSKCLGNYLYVRSLLVFMFDENLFEDPLSQNITCFANVFLPTASVFHTIGYIFKVTLPVFMNFEVGPTTEC